MVPKGILFYSTFSGAFVKWAELHGSICKCSVFGRVENKIINLRFEISFGTRILIFLYTLYLSAVGRDKSMHGLRAGEPVFLSRLLVWDCTNHSDYSCSPHVFYSEFTPKFFLWICKGSVTWRWPDTAKVYWAYIYTSTCTTLFLGLVLQLSKDLFILLNRFLKPSFKSCSRDNCVLNTGTFKIRVTNFMTACKWPGYAVAQLIEALRYKSEGRGFDSRLCHLT